MNIQDRFYVSSINLSRVPRPYFNMGVGEWRPDGHIIVSPDSEYTVYCVQTVFTNR